VLACEKPEGIEAAARRIEGATKLQVRCFPKEREYFIGFRIRA
jgi:hypothetical protein